MSVERRDPDEPDRPELRGEPTASEVDAAFAKIVADWEAAAPQWPAEKDATAEDATDDEPVAPAPPTDELDDEDDDHFVPPDPPPLPRPQPATVGAALLFAMGIVLLVVPSVIGLSESYGLPLGLLSITGSIVWLVARLRQGPPTDSGWDDGAQL